MASGALRSNECLSPARSLATRLGVHWSTVARVYKRLAAEGLLDVQHGRGVWVRERTAMPRASTEAAKNHVVTKLRDALTDARLAGLSATQVRMLFRQQEIEFKKRS